MVRTWSKVVLISLLVIAIAAPAFASTSRVRSLARTGDYLSDDSNVFRWYSTLPSYANMVQAEIGSWNYNWVYPGDPGGLFNSRALGLNYACGEDGKWGTYRVSLLENAVDDPGYYLVNPFIHMLSLSNAASEVDFLPFTQTPVNKWDLAGGWEIGDNSVAGFAFTRSSFKITDEQVDPREELSVSWTTLGFGYTYTNNEDLIADVAFTYAFAGGEYTATPVTAPAPNPSKVEWDKSAGFDIAARAFWDWKDYVTVVPVIDYMQSEFSAKSDGTGLAEITPPQGNKNKAMNIGVGLDIEVNGSNTVILAAEYTWAKFEYAQPDSNGEEISANILPTIRLALESEITSWLTTRVGALHRNSKFTYKYAGEDYKFTNNAFGFEDGILTQEGFLTYENGFEWFLGAGFNVAEWTIDMELAPETPFSMGWWLHGYSAFDSGTDYGPIARISGTYNF
jgi:hypothetical protein